MRNYISLLLFLLSVFAQAQTPLLDAASHPKFQNPIPNPTKVNLNSGTTTMQMAQTTQWLGLVDPSNNTLQTTVWGYGLNGGSVSYPGPTLVANSNSPANVEWLNNLPSTHIIPVDATYHKATPGAGIPTVVHLHGGHTEAVSDGHPEAWYTNNYAEKGPNWVKNIYTYDNSQEGATLWYHDHALGMTRANVYAGLAGFYLLHDANEQAIGLPSNQYDREIVVQDRMFDNTGQLFYPSDPPTPTSPTPSGQPEFFGDFIVVNGMVWPYMEVEPRKYRFRLLNGSDSRVYTFNLSNGASFLQIATDDGKLNNPVSLTQLDLAPGERVEIIVDFSTMSGQQITLLNTGPDAPFGNPASVQADPNTTGQIMQFRVNLALNTSIPDANITTATNLRPTLGNIQALGTPMKTRKLALFEGTDDLGRILPMLGIVDPTNPNDGSLTWHEPITENINLNDTEIWEIYNTTADAHPVHLHLVSFQILSKQTFTGTLGTKMQMLHNGNMGTGATLSNIVLTGTPTTFTAAESGWKDTHILMPGEVMQVKARFDKSGEYVWHCHILSHEDHDMMRKFSVANPCATDVTPPVISNCPTNKTLTTTGNCATATWTAPTVSDNCSNNVVPTFTTSPTSGLTNGGCFPLGVTTVSYMAMDANNNMSMCEFTVTVNNTNPCTNDVTPPVLSKCPTNMNLATTGTCAKATWAAPTATDNCTTTPSVSFTTSPTTGLTNGGCFPIGATTVSYKAVDAKNNTSTCTFLVNVSNTNPCANDVTPPVFESCPTNINLTTTGSCATATWTIPTAVDNCGSPTVTQSAGPARGSCFPVGTTKVTYMAMDAKGNMTTCSFNVTVTKQAAGGTIGDFVWKDINGNGLQESGEPGISGVKVQLLSSTRTLINSTMTDTYGKYQFTGLAAGTYIVKFLTPAGYSITLRDANNNNSNDIDSDIDANGENTTVLNTNEVNLTKDAGFKPDACISDVTPPIFSGCPANITLTTAGTSATATATWAAPIATDNCTTSPSVTSTKSSGSSFPIGTTTVTYTATDAKGNMATCSFTITVVQQAGGKVGDFVWNDKNGNGLQDSSEPGISGVQVQLLSSSRSVIATTTSDSYGKYYFTGISAGSYILKFKTPTGYSITLKDANNNNSNDIDSDIDANGENYLIISSNEVNMTKDAGFKPDACYFDTTPPVFSGCPANISLTTTGTSAVATWTAPKATDNCSTPTLTSNYNSGASFVVGTTTVNYTATDAKGNKATCSFTVTVTQPAVCNVNFSSSKCYRIVNRGSGKVLDVSGNSFSNYAPIIQWPYNGGSNEQVRFSALGSGYFKIMFRNCGKVLANHNTSSYSTCYLYDYYAGGAKDWKIECLNNGYYKITHRLSGKMLSIANNSTSHGANTEIRNWDGSNAQQWSIEEVPCASSAYLVGDKIFSMEAAADYKRSKIQWVNNSGENSDYFVVQKLNHITNEFEDIKVVNSILKNNNLNAYTEYDDNPTEGDNIYRVKLVLTDGVIVYTDLRKVNFKSNNTRVFPNPTEMEFNIDLKSYFGKPVSIYLYNQYGQIILVKHIDEVFKDVTKLDVSSALTGQYMIRIVSKGIKDFTQQVTVSH